MWLWRLSLGWRRGLMLAGTVGMTALVAGLFARGFFVGPADWVVAVGGALIGMLCLFGHFSWLLWMIGFMGWRSRPKGDIAADTPITTRTAFVMPIYHEDTGRVAAGIRQTWTSAKAAGLAAYSDYFVLSDSVDPEIRRAEEGAVEELQPLFAPPAAASGRLFLLRRADRVNYKAGNLANFLREHGGGYDFMLVLDADSVMLGGRIRRLILKLQQRPRTAVLQSLIQCPAVLAAPGRRAAALAPSALAGLRVGRPTLADPIDGLSTRHVCAGHSFGQGRPLDQPLPRPRRWCGLAVGHAGLLGADAGRRLMDTAGVAPGPQFLGLRRRDPHPLAAVDPAGRPELGYAPGAARR